MEDRFALLIDADNVSAKYIKPILDELSKYGNVTYKRIYGDWTKSNSASWKEELLQNSITPIQQFSYTQGKNSTDSAMIIDAMDMLYTSELEGFCLVSSDSDFTKLASRLKESEVFVFGVGEKKTPLSFRNACDDFIFTENLNKDLLIQTATVSKNTLTPVTHNYSNISELIPVLNKAWEQYQDDEGWANIAAVGSFVKRSQPDFDPRTYGAKKLPEIIESLKEVFEMTKYKGKGTVNIIAYKPKETID